MKNVNLLIENALIVGGVVDAQERSTGTSDMSGRASGEHVASSVRSADAPFVGWVAVVDDRIDAVGWGAAPEMNAARRIDARDCALMPGFVNAHAHSHSSLTRGSAEGLDLERWIATIEREQAMLSDDDAYAAALATYGEALLSGTTTILDMCLRPRPAIRAAMEIGIRAVVAPYVLDGRSFAPTLLDARQLLEECHVSESRGRVQVWVGLHDLESCSDQTITSGSALAAEFGVGLHMHCSESRFAVDQTMHRTGSTPIAHLHRLGALGPRTVLAHCVWANDADQALLSATGTSVCHCPHANLKLASGFAPVVAMQQAGITVTLATDGAKANNRLDMFDVMKFASLIHKGIALDASVLRPEAVLRMATETGARALGVPAGLVASGMLADLVLVDTDQFHLQPATASAIVTNLVHAARGSDVRTVVLNGDVVVDGGRLLRIDAKAALVAMQAAAGRLTGMAPETVQGSVAAPVRG